MNSELLIHVISFLTFIILLIWQTHSALGTLVQKRIESVKRSFSTAEYIKNFSVKVMQEEHEYQEKLPSFLKDMHEESVKKIQAYQKEIQNKLKETILQYKKDYHENVQKLNFQIVSDIKEEITNKIISELIKTMKQELPSNRLLKEVKKFIN